MEVAGGNVERVLEGGDLDPFVEAALAATAVEEGKGEEEGGKEGEKEGGRGQQKQNHKQQKQQQQSKG